MAVIHKYHLQRREHHTAVYDLSILQIEVKCYRVDLSVICNMELLCTTLGRSAQLQALAYNVQTWTCGRGWMVITSCMIARQHKDALTYGYELQIIMCVQQ